MTQKAFEGYAHWDQYVFNPGYGIQPKPPPDRRDHFVVTEQIGRGALGVARFFIEEYNRTTTEIKNVFTGEYLEHFADDFEQWRREGAWDEALPGYLVAQSIDWIIDQAMDKPSAQQIIAGSLDSLADYLESKQIPTPSGKPARFDHMEAVLRRASNLVDSDIGAELAAQAVLWLAGTALTGGALPGALANVVARGIGSLAIPVILTLGIEGIQEVWSNKEDLITAAVTHWDQFYTDAGPAAKDQIISQIDTIKEDATAAIDTISQKLATGDLEQMASGLYGAQAAIWLSRRRRLQVGT